MFNSKVFFGLSSGIFVWAMCKCVYHTVCPQHWPTRQKVLNNLVSATHSVSMTVVSGLSLQRVSVCTPELLAFSSAGYFLYDSACLLLQGPKQNIPLLYHHFITLYILYYIYNGNVAQSYFLTNLFFMGELSNFFNYVVYHYLKVRDTPETQTKQLKLLQLTQVGWFSYFRLYLFSSQLHSIYYDQRMYDLFQSLPYFLQFNMLMMFGLGFVWIQGQCRGLLK